MVANASDCVWMETGLQSSDGWIVATGQTAGPRTIGHLVYSASILDNSWLDALRPSVTSKLYIRLHMSCVAYRVVHDRPHPWYFTHRSATTGFSRLLSPVSTTRVDGPSWRVTGFHYPSNGPWTGHPSTRAVNSGSGNRPLNSYLWIISVCRLRCSLCDISCKLIR